jgi:glycosyltransferase involved in cell wall biosynthesis
MSELLQIPVTIHALWHAGSYDPQDFLGRLIGDASWVRHAEKSFYSAIDHNYFATEFHIELFCKNLLGYENSDIVRQFAPNKIIRSGWPMEYMPDTLSMYAEMTKKDIILFPHRIAPEKQLDIFNDLKEQLCQYEFVVCQERSLTKNEYHNMLGEAKLVFSANLQETLGISWYEGAITKTIPMIPDRLSYSEMSLEDFKYPSEWTQDWNSYLTHRGALVDRIIHYMENYESYLPRLNKQVDQLTENYFSCNNLLQMLK